MTKYKIYEKEQGEEESTIIEALDPSMAAQEYCERDWTHHDGNERMSNSGECDGFNIIVKNGEHQWEYYCWHEPSIEHYAKRTN